MRRSWNPRIWAGFALVLAGIFSYLWIFIRFPVTRDLPWVNFLVLAVALWLLGSGILRAFRQPQAYRGKVSGPVLGLLGIFLTGVFLAETLYIPRRIPASTGAPKVGQTAPDFTLPDSKSQPVMLSQLVKAPFGSNEWPDRATASGKTAAVLLIFYRGWW